MNCPHCHSPDTRRKLSMSLCNHCGRGFAPTPQIRIPVGVPMNVCPKCDSSADLEHHLADSRCTRCGVSWPRKDAPLRVSVTVAEKPAVTVKAEECWKCGVVPGATCGWQPCRRGLPAPEGWDQHQRIGNCGTVALPDGLLRLHGHPPMRGPLPTYEQIGPWVEVAAGAWRVAVIPHGPQICVVSDVPDGYGVWNLASGTGEAVPTREAADALLRKWYPSAVDPGIPVVSPTFGPVDSVTRAEVERECPRCADEAAAASDIMDVLRNPPPASPGMVEAITAARSIRRVDGPVTRTEYDALVARLAVVEERTRPLGPVAPALGDHVEALKERKRIVALLRSGAQGMDEAANASCTAAWARAADLIEAGDA